jgi:hypothetical protein
VPYYLYYLTYTKISDLHNCGIDIESTKVCILLYVDDGVRLGNNGTEWPLLLNTLVTWCYDNCMTINPANSNIVRTPYGLLDLYTI